MPLSVTIRARSTAPQLRCALPGHCAPAWSAAAPRRGSRYVPRVRVTPLPPGQRLRRGEAPATFRPVNLAAELLATAATDPDRVALRRPGGTVSFGELQAATRHAAGRLGTLAAAGERVAIVAANDELFVTAYLGVLGAGAIAVPLNPTAPPAELRRELDAVEATAI